ncbi:uncharacterized protein LOC121991341 [Zingiber officinale]|uniref:Uncharacterized protein n=1 Tax=Zingiber officinale TaxID=94328 RepID=A0A8J5KRN0_ZINOF|nr:uncharacterized protein LOC121991341 [Zingiber officinale]KAG6497198.1 hypothetical protein ZIOFF_045088 [Zingiber officinale]
MADRSGSGGWPADAWRSPSPHRGAPDGHLVPMWERRFCSEACGIPWERLCAIQRWMTGDMQERVMRWDDSAVAEAFRNAKARYCARYHGRPCCIPLPDPDMYIDDVDHDAFGDPELIADLEKPPPKYSELDYPAAASTTGGMVLLEDIRPTGWDEVPEPNPLNRGGVADAWDHSTGWDEVPAPNLLNRDGFVDALNQGDPRRSSGPERSDFVAQDNRRNAQWDTWEEKNRTFDRGRRNGRKREGGDRWGPRHIRPHYKSNSEPWGNCRGGGRQKSGAFAV